MSRRIEAILFDLGDTVLQFGDVDRDALFKRAAWQTYQLWAMRQQRMPDFKRYYLHQWFALRWGYFKMLLLRREKDAMRSIRRACRKLWLTAPDEFYRELAWEWYRPLAEAATLEPGTRGTLTTLRARGYRMALVSNTFIPGFVLDRHLAQLGLLEFFPERIYSCDVGYRKPHRRIFELALERVGTRAEQTVFVGDLPRADVLGARRMGMIPVWKSREDAPPAADLNDAMRIDRLAELPDLLSQIETFTAQAHTLSA